MENISIPSSVRIISDYAFINCHKLSKIIFASPNSIESFSLSAISECDSLVHISDFQSTKFRCVDNTLYYRNQTGVNLIYHVRNSIDQILIVDCDVICRYSFNNCNNIVNVSIKSQSVSLIEPYSFNNCLRLKYINFPLSVQSVQKIAFYECRSIRCPLNIENKSVVYLKMIEDSGIPRSLIVSCRSPYGSYKIQSIKRLYNRSLKFLYFSYLLPFYTSYIEIIFKMI